MGTGRIVIVSLRVKKRNSNDASGPRRDSPPPDPNLNQQLSTTLNMYNNGWLEDWAVVKMNDDWAGINGSWCDINAFGIAKVLKMKKNSKTKEVLGPFTCVKGGEIVAKGGASSGITGGIVNSTSFYMYHREEKSPNGGPTSLRPSSFSPLAKLELILPIGDKPFCRGGNSGAAVFGVRQERLGWCGILIGIGNLEGALNIPGGGGLMVLQSVVLEQMKGKRGLIG